MKAVLHCKTNAWRRRIDNQGAIPSCRPIRAPGGLASHLENGVTPFRIVVAVGRPDHR